MNSGRSTNLSLKYKRCTLSGCKDIGMTNLSPLTRILIKKSYPLGFTEVHTFVLFTHEF